MKTYRMRILMAMSLFGLIASCSDEGATDITVDELVNNDQLRYEESERCGMLTLAEVSIDKRCALVKQARSKINIDTYTNMGTEVEIPKTLPKIPTAPIN